jgi:aminopeptidase-like protein
MYLTLPKERLTDTAEEMFHLVRRLYPICRSITGDGVRETLKILQENIPLSVHEVPTATQVFDWTVPREWNIKDAYIKDPEGRRVVDFRQCNIHVVSYSVPVRQKMSLKALKHHLHTLPEQPEWIPYRTSYYKESWGFCLSHNQLMSLDDGEYEVCIDSLLEPGHLTFGEYYVPGEIANEVLISCHVCHPSLCNDNLSGIVLATFLAKHLVSLDRRYSYRFLFLPGTIGAITWLCLNERVVSKIQHGLILACVGDSGAFHYKKSRRGNAEIDRITVEVLRRRGKLGDVLEFSPYGYDERQFCSPGFNLPVGCFMRTPHGRFPEYHTSADNLEFLSPGALAESLDVLLEIVQVLENNREFLNLYPKCEPQLGRRGLYGSLGGDREGKLQELAMLWILNCSDGQNSLFDIAERSQLEFALIAKCASKLLEHGLLKEVSTESGAPVEQALPKV